jgi:hypothetical protein
LSCSTSLPSTSKVFLKNIDRVLELKNFISNVRILQMTMFLIDLSLINITLLIFIKEQW